MKIRNYLKIEDADGFEFHTLSGHPEFSIKNILLSGIYLIAVLFLIIVPVSQEGPEINY